MGYRDAPSSGTRAGVAGGSGDILHCPVLIPLCAGWGETGLSGPVTALSLVALLPHGCHSAGSRTARAALPAHSPSRERDTETGTLRRGHRDGDTEKGTPRRGHRGADAGGGGSGVASGGGHRCPAGGDPLPAGSRARGPPGAAGTEPGDRRRCPAVPHSGTAICWHLQRDQGTAPGGDRSLHGRIPAAAVPAGSRSCKDSRTEGTNTCPATVSFLRGQGLKDIPAADVTGL